MLSWETVCRPLWKWNLRLQTAILVKTSTTDQKPSRDTPGSFWNALWSLTARWSRAGQRGAGCWRLLPLWRENKIYSVIAPLFPLESCVSSNAAEKCYLVETQWRAVGTLDGISPGARGSSWGMSSTARADWGCPRPLHNGLLSHWGHPSFQTSRPGKGKVFLLMHR